MSEPLYVEGAAKYDQLFAQVTRSFIPALLDAARIAPGHRVLDVATGTGAAAEAAAALVGPGGEVSAGDVSSTMLDVARRNLKDTQIRLELFDGHALPFPDNSFDRVICQMGLQFFADPSQGLAEFRRVLAPNGRTAVVVNSTPERSLFTRIGTVIAGHVPAKAEMLNRYASIRTVERLRSLLRRRRLRRCRGLQRSLRFYVRPLSTTISVAPRPAPASRGRSTSSCPTTFAKRCSTRFAGRFPKAEAGPRSSSRWRCSSVPDASDPAHTHCSGRWPDV